MDLVARFLIRLLEFDTLSLAAPSTSGAEGERDVAYQQFLDAGIDLKSMSFLGAGKHGAAFDVGGGVVLKLTTDAKEAEVTAYLRSVGTVGVDGWKFTHIWHVFHVYELDDTQEQACYRWRPELAKFRQLGRLYAITGRNMLKFTDLDTYKTASKWLKKVVGVKGSGVLTVSLAKKVLGLLDAVERKEDLSGWPWPVPEGSAWVQYARFIILALRELADHGIVFDDYHKGNVMQDGTELKMIDIGLSTDPVSGPMDKLDA